MRCATRSAEETERLGAAVGRLLEQGDVVLLIGPLGAGKTTFVRGLARGLGFEGDVTSPTFTLSHVYRGRVPLVHADLWRLERMAEIEQLALDEEVEEGSSALVIEWGEAAEPIFGGRALTVEIESGESPDLRTFSFRPSGEWEGRSTALAGAAAAGAEDGTGPARKEGAAAAEDGTGPAAEEGTGPTDEGGGGQG